MTGSILEGVAIIIGLFTMSWIVGFGLYLGVRFGMTLRPINTSINVKARHWEGPQ